MSAKPRVKPTGTAEARPARAAVSAAAPSARAQGATLESYAAKLEPWQATLVRSLCALATRTAPKLAGSIKWGQPVFEQGGPVCYVKAYRSAVNFGFWRGKELTDPARLLEGSGEKMRHLKLTKGATIPEAALGKLIKQAIALNAAKGDPTRARSK